MEYKKITEEELKKVLVLHKQWLETDHKEGEMADLSYTDLSKFDIYDICFNKLSMSENIFIKANLEGANLSNLNLEDICFDYANLKGANLSNANLTDTCFNYADMENANLYEADITNSSFEDANLERADLRANNFGEGKSGCSLADFYNANLQYANLSCTNWNNANFTGANLRGADLSKSSTWHTLFEDADLQDVNFEGTGMNDAYL